MHPLAQFKEAAAAHVPGLLVLFDLAETKRRNCHLGHIVVDKDIDEFGRLIQSSVGASGLANRVRGASWLAMYRLESLQAISELLVSFHRQQEMIVGWRSTGERNGATKVTEKTVPATIIRAARCLYSAVITPKSLNVLIEKLFEECYGFSPDMPIELGKVVNVERSGWCCVSSYPSETPFCPFCERSDFEWDDGDTSVYSGTGTCKNCGAYVDIRGVELLQV